MDTRVGSSADLESPALYNKSLALSNGKHLFLYPLPGEGVRAESGRTQWLSSLLWLLEGNYRATYSIGRAAAVQ